MKRFFHLMLMFVMVGIHSFVGASEFLINGKLYEDTVAWTVTLRAGTVGSNFGDPGMPVRKFRYETVVTVNRNETLVIPGGVYSSNMSSSNYTVEIPLKDLGILQCVEGAHTYYLVAFTRNYELNNNDEVIGKYDSQVYVDMTVKVEFAGVSLEASDGEYDEYVEVKWKDPVSGETYTLYRDNQQIATNLGGSVYLDRTAELGTKYLYKIVASSGRKSNEDEGYRIIKPKLKILNLRGISLLEGHIATTNRENFLVAGETITVVVQVVDYDPEYHTLKSAKLIGKAGGGAAEQKDHEIKINTVIEKGGEDSYYIVSTNSLESGKGLHGNYQWHVEAVFEFKKLSTSKEVKSDSTNAPVFFHKAGQDNVGIPNWFTYWKEDGACPSLNSPYKGREVVIGRIDGYGEWKKNENEDKIYLHSTNAAGTHYDKEIEVESPTKHKFSGPHIWGIYTVEEVVAHELNHAFVQGKYEALRKSNSLDSDYRKPTAFWSDSVVVSVNGEMQVEHVRREYCDSLTDHTENVENRTYHYQLNINDCDTYNIATAKGAPEYTAYGDNEFLSMMAANKATEEKRAVKEKDWAFPGEQTCIPISTMEARWTLQQKNKKANINRDYGWYVCEVASNKSMGYAAQSQIATTSLAQTKSVTPRSQSVSPSITINEMTKEIVHDENTSLVSAISYKFNMMVDGFGDLRLSGILTDLNGNIVAYANTSVSSGSVSAELRFEGNDIYESGKNGPFKLESVKIVSFNGKEFSEVATLREFKDGIIELNRRDLSREGAYLFDIANETVTTNGIEITINAEINVAGEYEIFATLVDINGTLVASYRKAMNCLIGTNCVKLVFAASEILRSGIDGPYVIDNLALFKDGVRIVSRLDYSTLTKKYRADAFDFEDDEEIDSKQFMSQFEDYVPPPELPPSERFWVFFNPNGGTTSESAREVISGDKIGALPIPTLGNDEFLGWYTELEGGSLISESTVIKTNVLVYARWREIPDTAAFITSNLSATEGASVVVTIAGGTNTQASSVQLCGIFNTATADDLDLAKTLVDGKLVKGFKFPYTLSWTAGEFTNRTVTFFTKADKMVEDDEFFTLQIVNPVGMTLGEFKTCTVKVYDQNTSQTLGQAIQNTALNPKTSGSGKWIAEDGNRAIEQDDTYNSYAVSPIMGTGKQSTLSLASVSGPGTLYFSLKFVGTEDGEVPSKLSVYNGRQEIGWLTPASQDEDWNTWTVSIRETGKHTLSFKFTQGTNSLVQARITWVYWIPDSASYSLPLILESSPSEGGYTIGSGVFQVGTKMPVEAIARPGWEFVGWYTQMGNLFNEKIKQDLYFTESANDAVTLIAQFRKIPYVRGLADSVDGGKITGSNYCATGKKVTLKASANKNFTFKGWYATRRGSSNLIDLTQCVAMTPSLVIDRTGKPAKNTKTSTTITGVNDDVTYFALFEGDPHVQISAMPLEAGKVTGLGRYALGQKVTLKATANKGYVFAGWYQDADFTTPCSSELVDYRTPSYTYVMGEEDVEFYARFIPIKEDEVLNLSVNGTMITDETVRLTTAETEQFVFTIDSNSLPKVSVKGMPKGMKFTNKPLTVKATKTTPEYSVPINTLYGTSTTPGIYTVTVSLTNTTIKKAITKTFEIQVPNFTDDEIQVKDSYGPYIPGDFCIEEISVAEGCTVSGLPAGLKWTAKDIYKKGSKTDVETSANSVYGVPTKPGFYTVTFTKTVNKVKHMATSTFIIAPFPQLNVIASTTVDGVAMGKVTGMGGYLAGKQVTLKATANKGYVFAGWYQDADFTTPCSSELVDYRNPSYAYVMGVADTELYARFVTKAEEAEYEMAIALCSLEYPDLTLEEYVFPVREPIAPIWVMVDSLTLPKVTVKGLPKGLKFDAKTLTILGTPTTSGEYVVTVEATNASKSWMQMTTFYFTISP